MDRNKVLRLFLLIGLIGLLLLIYQIFRIIMIKVIFSSIGFSLFNEKIGITLAIIILTCLTIFISKKENISLSVRPDFRKNSKAFFSFATILVIVFLLQLHSLLIQSILNQYLF